MKLAGKVCNPGDPDWKPAANFVPPKGWPIPKGWRYDPQIGWSKSETDPGFAIAKETN